MRSKIGKFAVLAAAVLCLAGMASAQVAVDPALADYTPVAGVSGNMKSVGSDSMNNMMALWAEGFLAHYPNVPIEIEGKGSGTAPPALLAGTAHFGPMSRDMRSREVDAFEKTHGYKPTKLRVGIDMLAVFVHKDNPVAQRGLTLQEVDAIFSKTRRGGFARDIRTWGDLGLTGEWANRPISLYGRNAASGTYGFVRERALFGGDYKDEVREQPGSSAVVQGVATDIAGIGYSGIGYLTADVAAVPLARDAESKKIPATAEYAYTGEYPLSRFLYVFVNHRPRSQMDPLRREFIRYMFSKQGQADVVRDGYYPVTAVIANQDMKQVGIAK